MKGLSAWYIEWVRKSLPSPFSIAVIITFLSIILALLFTWKNDTEWFYPVQVALYWERGFWDLLDFAMQMVLILVLGHTLALSPWVDRYLNKAAMLCTNTPKAAFWISFTSILISFFNWGLCLVCGALFAWKVGKHAKEHGIDINYPLIGAAGYSGMMVWHGGFSGSAPLKSAESGHFLESTIGIIPVGETLLSPMNITASALIIIIIPLVFYYLGNKVASSGPIRVNLSAKPYTIKEDEEKPLKIDRSRITGTITGVIILGAALIKMGGELGAGALTFINLNYINYLLFGLALIAHGSILSFLKAATTATKGATGIILQFPLYSGVMGIILYSGLIDTFSGWFLYWSNEVTLPIFTFFSAALVNIFVPSGGGQWAVQGPIITEAAKALNVPVQKIIMAMAYGDQLTNMMQPFWALPLLSITRLKASDIIPYSALIMVAGAIVYIGILLIF